MLDFNNLEIAFSSKSDSELKNAHLLFSTLKHPGLVNKGGKTRCTSKGRGKK